MHLAHLPNNSDYTPEQMFAAKYAWLLQWALQFTENDRAAAEDLVQETFVRMLLTWDKLHTLQELEPLLYTYLRYAFLTERRKRRSYAFQSLSTLDADTLAISLRASTSFDQIEVQSEIRSILGFLLLRRRTAKFASMFLLRFFHGFYPEEIASIAVVTRHSVDLSLRQARTELKAHLLATGKTEVSTRLMASDQPPSRIAMPREDFADELLRLIFESPRDKCPSQQSLDKHYRSFTPRSLDCDLLAHIVVCRTCLHMVTTLSDSPPPSMRSSEDSWSYAPREKGFGKMSAKDQASVARIIGLSKTRMRDMFHHHPSGLIISLNGESVAERDVSSSYAVLKVETHSMAALGIVELHSAQGVLLLALPITKAPPLCEPELKHEIPLSGDRLISLVVRFTCDGVLVEAIYADPHHSVQQMSEAIQHEIKPLASGGELTAIATVRAPSIQVAPLRYMREWWRSIIHPVHHTFPRLAPFALASLALLFSLGVLQWLRVDSLQQQARFHRALADAVRTENTSRQKHAVGAIHERIQIKTLGKTIQTDIYRDAEGRRKPKAQQLDGVAEDLRSALLQAKVDWQDPLSAAAFTRWRDTVSQPADHVEEKSGLVVLTTDTTEGAVRSESLTLRTDTLHPIARTLLLETHAKIEIAELSYDVVPWNPVSSAWFESLEPFSGSSPRSDVHVPTAVPASPSDSELDLAMLSCLHALQQLHADAERLEVTRSETAIKVEGVVENDDRKRQIVESLRIMPNVESRILSYRDLDLHPGLSTNVSSVRAESVASGDSQLDRYCVEVHKSKDECSQLSSLLLKLSSIVVRESKRLGDLEQQYPPGKPLTPKAELLLAELVRGHAGRLNAALLEERESLEELGLIANFKGATGMDDPISLTMAAKLNLDVTRELVYPSDGQPRATHSMFEDLAISVQQVRTALSRLPVMSVDRSTASSDIPTPHSD